MATRLRIQIEGTALKSTLAGRPPQPNTLAALTVAARKSGRLALELEVRLASAAIQMRIKNGVSAQPELKDLETTAVVHGFNLIAQKTHDLQSRPRKIETGESSRKTVR
jgi:hypothetical protein